MLKIIWKQVSCSILQTNQHNAVCKDTCVTKESSRLAEVGYSIVIISQCSNDELVQVWIQTVFHYMLSDKTVQYFLYNILHI
jgi:hypothetical protein